MALEMAKRWRNGKKEDEEGRKEGDERERERERHRERRAAWELEYAIRRDGSTKRLHSAIAAVLKIKMALYNQTGNLIARSAHD